MCIGGFIGLLEAVFGVVEGFVASRQSCDEASTSGERGQKWVRPLAKFLC